MAKHHNYIVGKTYGCQELLYLHRKDNRLYARTRCIYCEKESDRIANGLFSSKYSSCRCRSSRINGLSSSRIYSIYYNMLDRCNNQNSQAYEAYGKRGVKVCQEWSCDRGFLNFYNWSISNGYTSDMTIDRIDSDLGYSPDNCQWVTKAENTSRANKQQHRKANRGEYYGISPDGEFYRFWNANEFCKIHPDLNAGKVRTCANGQRKSHKQWKFGFVADLNLEPLSTIESIA